MRLSRAPRSVAPLVALCAAACGTAGDPNVDVDVDADGFTDVEEAACRSDPADAASTCYACGWKRHDPGDLVATGAAQGDTIENMLLIDQCGEEVPLWDLASEYHVLFLTAAWCTRCQLEAAGFMEQMVEAEAEGRPFTYLVALFESQDAGVPTAADAAFWARAVGVDTPVLSDPSQLIKTRMPFEGAIPARCALTPRMEMVHCYTGEAPNPDPALEALRAEMKGAAGGSEHE